MAILKQEYLGALANISINRPEALNALNEEVLDNLEAAVDDLAQNPEIRVVVLSGEGEKSFVAGADIAAMRNMNSAQSKAFSAKGHRIFKKIEDASQVWIAKVGGFALGGGMELAMSCDLIYAHEKSKFGQPEVNLGLIPGFGGCLRLVKRAGISIAKDLILSGRMIKAQQAKEMGIINDVFSLEEFDKKVAKIAADFAQKSPITLSVAKSVLNQIPWTNQGSAALIEQSQFGVLFSSEDTAEGLAAFLEKRPAVFKGK